MEFLCFRSSESGQALFQAVLDIFFYYEAFDSYYRVNDAGAMVQMVAEYVEERLNRYMIITNEGGM